MRVAAPDVAGLPLGLAAELATELATFLAAFLALLLGVSALHKAVRAAESARAVQALTGASPALAPFVVAGAALAEAAAALLLLGSAYRATGAVLGAVLLGAYLAALARALRQGRRAIDCGCRFGGPAHTLGGFEIARNAVLVGLALLVAAATARSTVPVGSAHLLPAAALLALYAALDQVMGLAPPRRGATL